jgi:hypothetical protein
VGLLLFDELPHPVKAAVTAIPSRNTIVIPRHRRRGRNPQNIRAASAVPEGSRNPRKLAVAAVEVTVSVVLPAVPDDIVTLEGLRLQAGVSFAVPVPVNFTAQVRLTVPENPLAEAI